MSFIITRSDLLAPKKEQVDAMMPTLSDILRDALQATASAIRLGNVRCVSSKRGWWTKKLKNEIWERGGGGWMVGMVNVGKSNLFEAVFPKGGNPDTTDPTTRNTSHRGFPSTDQPRAFNNKTIHTQAAKLGNSSVSTYALLPPAPMETAYPVMPTVSHVPGTTASPIRLLFGGGKGELVDLPGVSRGDLSQYILDEHKANLVMRTRIKAKQFTIRPGQSLMLANLIRITPRSPNTMLLAYPFVPLECHVTNTEKASMFQSKDIGTGFTRITRPGVGTLIASAGNFELQWDVTKQRAGPLTARSAVGLKADELPFVVVSADILIEGIGWVELAAQVRKKALENDRRAGEAEAMVLPSVEIFSPNGANIGIRRPLNAWLVGGEKKAPKSRRTTRPRRSMRGVKKMMKRNRSISHSNNGFT